MARFYANENFPLPVVEELRRLGHHREQPNHSGVVVCTFDTEFVGLARRIHDAVGAEPGLSRKLIRVNRPAH